MNLGTWKRIGVWFLVFLGEILLFGEFPGFSLVLIVVMMAYNIPRRYRTTQRKKSHIRWDAFLSESELDDITAYPTTKDIFASGRFTPEERRGEYRRRGKSPSGFIDGVYNDMNLENGEVYNDMDRDWEADA